jgi:hypothetical protein
MTNNSRTRPKSYRFAILILLLIGTETGFGQHYEPENPMLLNKNTIHGSFGADIGEFYGTLLVNYERMILQFPESSINSLSIRVGAGPWVWWSASGINLVSTASVLTGKKSSHLEIGIGLLLTYNNYEKRFDPLINNRHLAGNFGYRYQKPGKSFVFRTGIGWPEYTYLGGGFSF